MHIGYALSTVALAVQGLLAPSLQLDFLTGTFDPRVTFTRASNGTYFGSDGRLKTAPVNLLANSHNLTSYWNVYGGAYLTAPETCVFTGSNQGLLHNGITTENGVIYTMAVLISGTSGQWASLLLEDHVSPWSSYSLVVPLSNTPTMYVLPYAGTTGAMHVICRADNATVRINAGLFKGNWSVAQIMDSGGIPRTGLDPNSNPRFDRDPVTLQPKGLLIEGQATNLLWASNDISQWGSHPSVTKARNQVGLDGIPNTATLVTAVSGQLSFTNPPNDALLDNNARYVRYAIAKAGTTSKIVLEKEDNGTWDAVVFDLSTNTFNIRPGIDASIRDLGGGVKLCAMSWVTGATGQQRGANFYIDNYGPAAKDCNLTLYHLQLEKGSRPTSPIITAGSQATRAADIVYSGGSDFTGFYNPKQGTFIVEVTGHAPQMASEYPWILDVSNASYSSQIGFYTFQSQAVAKIKMSDVTQLEGAIVGDTSQNYKLALAYSATGISACGNGGSILTNTGSVPQDVDRLLLRETVFALDVGLDSQIRKLTYYPYRLSDARLQALTAL